MLHEGLRHGSQTEQSPTELRVAILDTIYTYCEGVTIGSPKIVALNDIAESYAAQSRVLETEDQETPTAERVAALVAQETIGHDIKYRSITVHGYAQAHNDLGFQAFRLVSAWKRISEKAYFSPGQEPKNPEQSVSLELGNIVEELTKSPNFSK
jgi:hypothetical protein